MRMHGADMKSKLPGSRRFLWKIKAPIGMAARGARPESGRTTQLTKSLEETVMPGMLPPLKGRNVSVLIAVAIVVSLGSSTQLAKSAPAKANSVDAGVI